MSVEREIVYVSDGYKILATEKTLLTITHPEPDDITEVKFYSPGTYRFRFPCGYIAEVFALSLHRAMAIACQYYGDYSDRAQPVLIEQSLNT